MNRSNVGYTEKHHIIPKCMGGDNTTSNIAVLTAREHFVCHRLLIRMTSGKDKQKMAFAIRMFLRKNPKHDRPVVNSNTYEYIKRIYSENMSLLHKGKTVSQESIHKRLATMKINGKKRTPEMKLHQSNLGKERWENNREVIISHIHSAESNIKKSIAAKARGMSDSTLVAFNILWVKQKGAGNPRARKIQVTSPTNIITIIHGEFQKFCRENDLPFSTMCAKLKGRVFTVGKTVGWHVEYVD